MGFSPQAVDAMSLWKFLAARTGWIRANMPDDPGRGLTPSEVRSLGDWLDQPPPWAGKKPTREKPN
jgi:hypothetical protein